MCTNLFLCLKLWKNQMQMLQCRKNGKNSRTYRHGSWRKSETKMRWSLTQAMRAKPYSLLRQCISRFRSWSRSFYNTKAEWYSDVTFVKDDSGSYAVFTEQGSSASQMTAAQVMDIISRLPGCAGQAADAVSAYTQVKMDDAPALLKIPESECPDVCIRPPRHKWPKTWFSMEDPVVPLERNLYGHPLAGLLWKRQFDKVLVGIRLGKSSK